MRKRAVIALITMMTVFCAAAGCGTGSLGGGSGQQNEAASGADKENDQNTQGKAEGSQNGDDQDHDDQNDEQENDEQENDDQENDDQENDDQDNAEQENDEQEHEMQIEEKKEVSREDYPDCDGSGHGYVEITYSDGSVVVQEY